MRGLGLAPLSVDGLAGVLELLTVVLDGRRGIGGFPAHVLTVLELDRHLRVLGEWQRRQ
jgi:hypothetical protein